MRAASHSPTGAQAQGVSRVVRAIAAAPIVIYQKVVSPAIPRRCKYEPTCSRYGVEAIRTFGVGRGLVLAVWRVLRCNPWSYGGYDPVEAQRLFRGTSIASAEQARPDQQRTATGSEQ